MTHKPSERRCAERFVKWYNIENRSNYRCCEAEEHFPELNKNKKKKWDYVLIQKASSIWIAVEVKHVPRFLSIGRSVLDWRKFCQKITDDIQSKVIGIFSLHFPPPLKLRQNQRKRLSRALVNVIAEAAPIILVATLSKDLGPKVAEQFPEWPTQESDGIAEYDEWGEFRPHELFVFKESGEGCEVKLGGLSNGANDVVAAHNQALDKVFLPKNPKGITANAQLLAAKEKGAGETILLLDCPLCEYNLVSDYVRRLDPSIICNIGCIYLAGSGDSEFSRVL